MRLPGAPDPLPLHAPRLRLQFLRQDSFRSGKYFVIILKFWPNPKLFYQRK